MADYVYTISLFELARVNWATLDIRSVVMDDEEAEATMRDHADMAALIAAVGNTTFGETVVTGYLDFQHAAQTATPDLVNNRYDYDMDDASFGAIGNATNGTAVSIITYDFDTSDALSEPVSHHDAVFTTDGTAVTVQWAAAGVWRAAA
jgi:hypothetical protein